MIKFTQSLSQLLDGVKKAYKQDQIDKGIRASGKSAKSIRKASKATEGQLTGSKYFFEQKHGRRPGKFPPISEILNWIRDKSITPREVGTSIKSLAFIFARSIAQKGTQIYRGIRKGLDPQIQELVAAFSRQVAKDIRKDIKTSFR